MNTKNKQHCEWTALGFLCFNLPEPKSISISELSDMVREIKSEINQIKIKK